MAKEIEPLIKIEEVAERLALTVHGIRKLARRRAIPSVKLGYRCLRFKWSEVEAAINRYRVKEIS
jgi:excisionase family DNA binding protein